MLKVKLLSDLAIAPLRGSTLAAGYDLFCVESITLECKQIGKVHTHISLQIPSGYYGRIAPRSSLGAKGILINGGVIDVDYTGEVLVIMHNLGDQPITFPQGSKIAQLILEKNSTPEVEIVQTLCVTKRGEGGFGSTGQ